MNKKARDPEVEAIVDGFKGVFGDAVAAHDVVTQEMTGDGFALTSACGGCGRATEITVEWPELVAMKFGADPAAVFRERPGILHGDLLSWRFDPREMRWRPIGKCSICGFHYNLRISPDEPERMLSRGRQAGYINRDGEHGVTALCMQHTGRVPARRA